MRNFTIRIDISRARDALGRLPDAVSRNVDPQLSRGAEEVAITARNNAPKAFSNLANSIMAQNIGPLHYEVATNQNYAAAVEGGSRPHFPNRLNLEPWVERVLGLRGREARDASFLIARSISIKGTRYQPYMSKAAESDMWRVRELVLAGVDAGIREAMA